VFKTAIDQHTTGVALNAFWWNSRIKQYLKDGRALRIETVINSPDDLGCARRLLHLDELQHRARACNRRLLDAERVGQGSVLASPAFERIARPSVTTDGRRAPALRFGDPRVQALAGALTTTMFAVTGITNKSLRALMPRLFGDTYSMNQASYDLALLRLNGLIRRVPGHNRYTLTRDGLTSRSSTARSTTGSSDHCSPPTDRLPHPSYVPRSAPSTSTSTTGSPTPGCQPQPETQDNCQRVCDQAKLGGQSRPLT
jgi:hypothetical protein